MPPIDDLASWLNAVPAVTIISRVDNDKCSTFTIKFKPEYAYLVRRVYWDLTHRAIWREDYAYRDYRLEWHTFTGELKNKTKDLNLSYHISGEPGEWKSNYNYAPTTYYILKPEPIVILTVCLPIQV